MSWMDVLLAFDCNLSLIAFALAITTTIFTLVCIVGLLNTSKEFEEIEMMSAIKMLLPLTIFLWVLSAAPTVKEVKKVQEIKDYKEDNTEEIKQIIEKYEKFKKENVK